MSRKNLKGKSKSKKVGKKSVKSSGASLQERQLHIMKSEPGTSVTSSTENAEDMRGGKLNQKSNSRRLNIDSSLSAALKGNVTDWFRCSAISNAPLTVRHRARFKLSVRTSNSNETHERGESGMSEDLSAERILSGDTYRPASAADVSKGLAGLYEMGIVATVPYHGSSAEVRAQLASWVYHHVRVGFRVFIYDRNGTNEKLVRSSISHFALFKESHRLDSYRNNRSFVNQVSLNISEKTSGTPTHNILPLAADVPFELLSLLSNSTRMKIKYWDSMIDYHPYTVRSMLGYDDKFLTHARSDQDKALTYTFCRFEHQARFNHPEENTMHSTGISTSQSDVHNSARTLHLTARTIASSFDVQQNVVVEEEVEEDSNGVFPLVYPTFLSGGGVKSMLICDFDEFVYCPDARSSSYIDQYRMLVKTVTKTRYRHSADEIVLGRFSVPNISAIPGCLETRFIDRRLVFACYAGWDFRTKHNTIKAMHHSVSCPNTDFHFACTSSCACKRKYQAHCSLLHLRPLHAYSFKGSEKSVQKRANMYLNAEYGSNVLNSSYGNSSEYHGTFRQESSDSSLSSFVKALGHGNQIEDMWIKDLVST